MRALSSLALRYWQVSAVFAAILALLGLIEAEKRDARREARRAERTAIDAQTRTILEEIETRHDEIESENARGGDDAVLERLRDGTFLLGDPARE